jgi:hypothetical protein
MLLNRRKPNWWVSTHVAGGGRLMDMDKLIRQMLFLLEPHGIVAFNTDYSNSGRLNSSKSPYFPLGYFTRRSCMPGREIKSEPPIWHSRTEIMAYLPVNLSRHNREPKPVRSVNLLSLAWFLIDHHSPIKKFSPSDSLAAEG